MDDRGTLKLHARANGLHLEALLKTATFDDAGRVTELKMSGMKIGDLSPLARLTGLIELDVSRTKVADLSPLAALSRLTTLNVSCTDITDLTPLGLPPESWST